MSYSHLGDILRRGRLSNARILQSDADSGHLNQTVVEVGVRASDLRRGASVSADELSRGQTQLAQFGVNVGQVAEGISGNDFRIQLGDPGFVDDVANVYATQLNERHTILIAAAEDTLQASLASFRERQFGSLDSEWEIMKQELVDELGSSSDWLGYAASDSADSSGTSVRELPQFAAPETLSTLSGKLYSRLAQPLLEGFEPSRLLDVIAAEDIWADHMPVWNALRSVTEAVASATIEHGNSRTKSLLANSMLHLQSESAKYIKHEISTNQCPVGAAASNVGDIRAYVDRRVNMLSRSRAASNEFSDEACVWMVIFYCIRCGYLEAAVSELAEVNKKRGGSCSELLELLKQVKLSTDEQLAREYPSSKIQQLRSAAKNEYDRISPNTADGRWPRIVYNVIGGFAPVHDRAEFRAGDRIDSEDSLYLQLVSVLHSENVGVALAELHAVWDQERGAGLDHVSFARQLVLGLHFHELIHVLSLTPPEGLCLSVHVGFLLHLLRLLQSPADSASAAGPIHSTPVRFQRVLVRYIDRLSSAYHLKRIAANYLSVVRGLQDTWTPILYRFRSSSYVSRSAVEADWICFLRDWTRAHLTVSELVVIVSRQAVGAVDTDSSGREILSFQDFPRLSEADLSQWAISCANDCLEEGQIVEAIRLFDASNHRAKAIDTLNNCLTQYISPPKTEYERSIREQLMHIAKNMLSAAPALESPDCDAVERNLNRLQTLFTVSEFFLETSRRRFMEAITLIMPLNPLPSTGDSVDPSPLRKLDARTLSDIYLALMTCLLGLYEGGTTDRVQIQQYADALVKEASTLENAIIGDTYMQLVYMNSRMH